MELELVSAQEMNLQLLRCSIRASTLSLASSNSQAYQLHKILACPWCMIIVHFTHYRSHRRLQNHVLHYDVA